MRSRMALGLLNHLLQDATWARTRLASFAGRTVRFALPPWHVDVAVDLRGQFAAAATEAPDAEVALPINWAAAPALPVLAPLALLSGQELVPRLRISGEPELAATLRFVLGNLRWDYEEDLAQRLGDIPAHRIAGIIQALAAWQRQAARSLSENLGEYLLYEQGALARPAEMAALGAEINALQREVAEAERRLARLEAAAGGRPQPRQADTSPSPP